MLIIFLFFLQFLCESHLKFNFIYLTIYLTLLRLCKGIWVPWPWCISYLTQQLRVFVRSIFTCKEELSIIQRVRYKNCCHKTRKCENENVLALSHQITMSKAIIWNPLIHFPMNYVLITWQDMKQVETSN